MTAMAACSNLGILSDHSSAGRSTPLRVAVFLHNVHKAQVRLEAGESSIEIEIEIVFEIDSVQFCASVRLDTDFDFDFDSIGAQLELCE
jgi:hypothetical protein